MFLALKFAYRQLLKTPGFTATALATLAICLGANLTIFAVVDAILVRSLPFPEAGRLVTVLKSYPGAGVERSGASIANYYDRRGAIKAFSSLSIRRDDSVIVGEPGSPSRVQVARVSPEFFATLGVPIAMGKAFTDNQLTYGTDEVAILTDGYWRSHFNADRNVVGRTFLNDGLTITVIGVLPRNFHYLSSRAEIYRPAASAVEDRKPDQRHSNNWEMIARLAPGATLADAQAQMDAFDAKQAADDPYAQLVKDAGYHTTVRLLHADHVREVRPVLILLQCGVLFLLLIGGVNLANLLLIRASGRTKELAVRQALGAGRRHIAMDALVETTLLAACGGVCGLMLGAFGIDLLRTLGTEKLPLGATIAFDSRVAAFALAAAIVVGLLLAVPTIWLNLHTKLAAGLQAESRSGTASRGAQRLRHVFIVAQVALAFVLLSGAGLLSVSLRRVLETPAGFNPGNILTGNISLPWKNYKDDASRLAFVERLLPAIRQLPGVTQVALSSGLPFSGDTNDSAVSIEGVAPKAGAAIHAHYLSAVSGDYWRIMQIPLVSGRLLSDDDNHRKAKVCVVDQAFAERYWPGADPLGHRITNGPSFNKEDCFRVVGVVASVKQNELAENIGHGAVYFTFADFNARSFYVVAGTALPPASMAPMIQKAILQIDPDLPIDDFRPMRSRIDDTLVARRSPAILAGIFAAVALLLAAIGTYGVLSYAVVQRQREIGVRMALGAHPDQIRNQFLSLGLRLLAAGTVLGTIGAWFAGRAMQSILFKVPTIEGASFAGTVVVMSLVSLSACMFPARRAAAVDPVIALRAD